MTTAPARRPVVTIPTQPRPPKPDWRNVFLEPAYGNGQDYRDSYGDEDDPDDANA